MPNQGFKLDFKMFLEGIEVPFKSASVASTPNGTEASINIYANRLAHDLLPKTAVQIFFKEWIPSHEGEWRLMFDGFISAIMQNEGATEGRMMSIVCRDSTADLNKIPAAIVYDDINGLNTLSGYTMGGIHRTTITPGVNGGKEHSQSVKTYNKGAPALNPLTASIRRTAGNAQGGASTKKTPGLDGEPVYNKFSPCFSYKKGKSKGGLFLDSYARGIWMESAGASNVAAFLNKRIRVNKKMFIPVNDAGYEMWTEQSSGAQIGSYLMGNAKMSSVMASIMRIAGLFSTRVFSCATPSPIFIGEVDGKDAPAVEFSIDPKAKDYLVDNSASEYGPKYMLNETMLLPALEFTAPPQCNIVTPPMYTGLYWTHDYDVDITRGMYKQADLFPASGNSGIHAISIQIPNTLLKLSKLNLQKDGRQKLPLTLEERYKGVNPDHGRVSYKLGLDDAVNIYKNQILNASAKADLEDSIAELEALINGAKSEAVEDKTLTDDLESRLAKKKKALRGGKGNTEASRQVNAVQRHALIRFLGKKYGGRVMQVAMMFNPYIMAGFPSVILSSDDNSELDDEENGDFEGKAKLLDIIGQVQQVQHDITITPSGADATTSIVLNGARFVSEPTDMDKDGNALYSKPTNKKRAKINDDLEYADDYFVADPKPRVKYKPEAYTVTEAYKALDKVTVYDNAQGEVYDFEARQDEMAAIEADITKSKEMLKRSTDVIQGLEATESFKSKKYKDALADQEAQQEAANQRYLKREAELDKRIKDLEDNPPLVDFYDKLSYKDKEAVDNDFARRLDEYNEKLATSDINTGLALQYPKRYINPIVKRTYKTKYRKVTKYKYSPYDLRDVSDGVNDDYKYAKDYLTITSEQYRKAEVNFKYLDDRYSPNKIARFYKNTFGLKDNIMIGQSTDGDEQYNFYYDTIHEAVVNFKINNEKYKDNYEFSMDNAWREICSADLFFGGIIEASRAIYPEWVSRKEASSGDMYFYKKDKNFNPTEIDRAYYGVPSKDWESIEPELKSDNGGLMSGPGDFSSILENMPITPFIKERRVAVEKYINSVTDSRNHASGDE